MVEELSHAQGLKLLDRHARCLGMSAKGFIEAYDAGKFEGSNDPTVLDVAMLLPFGRP